MGWYEVQSAAYPGINITGRGVREERGRGGGGRKGSTVIIGVTCTGTGKRTQAVGQRTGHFERGSGGRCRQGRIEVGGWNAGEVDMSGGAVEAGRRTHSPFCTVAHKQ